MAKDKDKGAKTESGAASMVPDRPATANRRGRTPGGQRQPLRPVEGLAKDAGLPAWEVSALMRAAGWAPGKQVGAARFADALTRFRGRPQGGGKIF